MEIDLDSDPSSLINHILDNTSTNIPQSCNVFPGDDLTTVFLQKKKNFKLGSGLVHQDGRIRSNVAGAIKSKNSTYWIQGISKRGYIPKVGDQVVGIIEDKGSEFYRVNICSGTTAILDRLGFEGSTRRNKPELKRGDLIYTRVCDANRDIDPEVTCLSSSGYKKDWSSGEAVYGPLEGGLLLRLNVNFACSLLRPSSPVLCALGKHFAYEVAIGVNGFVWFKAALPLEMVVIRNALLNAESFYKSTSTPTNEEEVSSLNEDEIAVVAMVEQLVLRVRK